MKIHIGICTGGQIHVQTVASLIGSLDYLKNHGEVDYKVSMHMGGDKPRSMNKLVRETLDDGYEYLMSVDTDMVFPADGIARLVENDKDIVGANYSVRGTAVDGNPREAVIKMADKNGKRINMPMADLPKRLFKCNGLGNGFILYKAEVFRKTPMPWFYVKEDEKGNWSGEDILFHEAAQLAGFEVWCNPLIKVGHIGTFNYEI